MSYFIKLDSPIDQEWLIKKIRKLISEFQDEHCEEKWMLIIALTKYIGK
ncbi:hypothetical protein [Bacillus taeanensis]|nr:hypothetical protein [Bacillus taeanensis]